MDTYNSMSKEKLINKINELETMLEALKEEKNKSELLKFPWVGNLGHWYWNIKTDNLICNDWKFLALNYTKDEMPKKIGFEFFTSKLHPDDYEQVMDNMRQHLQGKTDAYEVEYRIETKDKQWKWYYDRGKVSKTDEMNQPLLVSGIVFDITQAKRIELLVKEQNKRLERLVDFDCLTDLLNRRGLMEILESEIDKANKNKENLSIIMMDIDKFKLINDNYGHLVGDRILKQLARVIKDNMLEKDFVGRYGGEEFLIILPNTTEDQACILADRIRKDIANTSFTNDIHLTISGGVSEYKDQSINMLIDKADKNLYQAKNKGRNQIICD